MFSQEILDYFKSIETNYNKPFILKYFQVLSDPLNITAEKYNIHHIRPCFTFKDELHKNRTTTQKLADSFNGNKIKLSVYNHLLAHYYLWKIFDNIDSKHSFQRMCGQNQYKNNLSEDEIIKIARLKEECTKNNVTNEEKAQYSHDYYKNNSEKIIKKHRDKRLHYYKENKAIIRNKHKIWLNNNKKQHLARTRELKHRLCKDPIKQDICTYSALSHRKIKNKVIYKDVMVKNCLVEETDEIIKQYSNQRNKIPIKNRLCKDPIKHDICTYSALSNRISRHKDLYNNISITDCIVTE